MFAYYSNLAIKLKKKITVSLVCTALVLAGIILIPNAFAENVPVWVKNTAGWWATDAISETEFVNAVEFLVKEDIIQVDTSQTSETSQGVPVWVKNTAGWWATDAISETEFVNAIAYLINVGIINIESSKSPELIAEMWVNDQINDDEFLRNVENLIEKDIIPASTNTSDLPDWLVNNAGWWAARILTNSDFSFDPGYIKENIYPCTKFSADISCISVTTNSNGFRGGLFLESKASETDFRIFAVGGSNTFGVAVEENEIWVTHLQQISNEKIKNKKVEVINAGMHGATAESEYGLIKHKLSSFDPDLIIMYDGLNDSLEHNNMPAEKTIQNWKSVCELGKENNFGVIIIIQPIVVTDQRVLTDQEITSSFSSFGTKISDEYLQKSQQYVDAFEELDEVCTKTADFRRIFDYVQEPIFWDGVYTLSFGHKILAENIFSVISPIYFGETYSVIHNNLNSVNNEPGTDVVYAVGSDLSGRNFDNLNLENAVFDSADLSNTSFKNTNIDGARFAFANLDNSNLLNRIDLSNINLVDADLSNTSLKGKDLSGTNLSFVDLSGHDLTDTNLTAVNLSHAKISNTSLKGKDLSDTILTGADLTDTILTGADLSGANLSYVDLSEHDLTDTNLSDTFLLRTNLSGIDLRSIPLTDADFRYADLSGTSLSDSLLVNNNFDHATLSNIDFAGKDLSNSSFQQAKLEGSDMQDTNLTSSVFIQVDFTKIKNKSLAGSDFTTASFAHSNLSGVNISAVILKQTNFWNADLSSVDFTGVSNGLMNGMLFTQANLSNSNFEGLFLGPQGQYKTVLKDKAYLASQDEATVYEALFEEEVCLYLFCSKIRVLILTFEARGNDLIVNWILFNNFDEVNFENANFKNTILWNASFASANLTNVDLSGADLSGADLSGADLSGADLSGANLYLADLSGANLTNANLSGAVLTDTLTESTILKCKNHPICLNE